LHIISHKESNPTSLLHDINKKPDATRRKEIDKKRGSATELASFKGGMMFFAPILDVGSPKAL